MKVEVVDGCACLGFYIRKWFFKGNMGTVGLCFWERLEASRECGKKRKLVGVSGYLDMILSFCCYRFKGFDWEL